MLVSRRILSKSFRIELFTSSGHGAQSVELQDCIPRVASSRPYQPAHFSPLLTIHEIMHKIINALWCPTLLRLITKHKSTK
jgi:hypothetical protein